MSDERMTGTELRRRIDASLAAFERELGAVDVGTWTDPAMAGGWSVKDVLAHLALWHEVLLDWLAAVERGEPLTGLAPGYEWNEIDRVNADAYEQRKAWTVEQAERAFRESTASVMEALDGLDDETLNTAWPESNDVVWQWFMWDTYEHYDEHTAMLREAFGEG